MAPHGKDRASCSSTAHPQQQHRDKRPRRDAVAIRTHRPHRTWDLHQQLEPASGNHGLGLQEKGGSGYSSALSFNRRIIQHKELFFPKKFLAKFTDVRSCRDEKRADIIRSRLQGWMSASGRSPQELSTDRRAERLPAAPNAQHRALPTSTACSSPGPALSSAHRNPTAAKVRICPTSHPRGCMKAEGSTPPQRSLPTHTA